MTFQPPDDRQSEFRCRSHFKNGIEIQKRLAGYKDAKPLDVAYYTRMAREAPARAVDMLLYKDMIRDEDGMLLVEHAMPELEKIYSILDEKAQARIDNRVRQFGTYQKGKIFAAEVFREVGRALRRTQQGQSVLLQPTCPGPLSNQALV